MEAPENPDDPDPTGECSTPTIDLTVEDVNDPNHPHFERELVELPQRQATADVVKPKAAPKQRSVLDFKGFSSSAPANRGQDIEHDKKVTSGESVYCPHCGDKLGGNRGSLQMHINWKHPNVKIATRKVKDIQTCLKSVDEQRAISKDVAKFVMEHLIKSVIRDDEVEVIQIPDSPPAKKSRKNMTFKEKADILNKYYTMIETEGAASFRVMEEMLGVSKSVLQRLVSNNDEIMQKAADEILANLKRGRPTSKHAATFILLYQEFKKARGFGKKVSFLWLWVKGRKIAAEKSYPVFTRSATQQFIKKQGVKIRRVQFRKNVPKSVHAPKLRDWHVNFREGVIKSGRDTEFYDNKWGRFPPPTRYNVDQVPLPFAMDVKTTYEMGTVGHKDKVWVRQPGSGLEKRQCTLQLCFSPQDSHVKPEIIFRGTGEKQI